MNNIQQLFDSLCLEGDASRGDLLIKIQRLTDRARKKQANQQLISAERDAIIKRMADTLGLSHSEFPNFFEND